MSKNDAHAHGNPSRETVDRLKESQIFRDYEQAFTASTGLPLALRAVGDLSMPLRGRANENPFCALLAKTNKSCAACLQFQSEVEKQAGLEPKTLKCFAGLCDSAVPIRVGENVVAFLQTGQILLNQPSRREFTKFTEQLLQWGSEVDVKRLEELYFQTRVLKREQYEAVLRLLNIFAQHLAALSNQLAMRQAQEESPQMTKARQFIETHQHQEISLHDAAAAVNMSAFYFCKTFKQATGLTFTDYLARVRIEKVKSLLLNPHKRISEAAFEAGFQSLSQFNRVFRRVTGEAPTVWRAKLPGSSSAT